MSVIRIVIAAAVAVAWVGLAWVGSRAVGFGASQLGWLSLTGVFGVGLIGAGLLLRRRSAVACAAVTALALGLAGWYFTPPDHDRLLTVANTHPTPLDWHRLEDMTAGTTNCFKECPELHRHHRVPGDLINEYVGQLELMQDEGWQPQPRTGTDMAHATSMTLVQGRWEVTVSYQDRAPDDKRVVMVWSGRHRHGIALSTG